MNRLKKVIKVLFPIHTKEIVMVLVLLLILLFIQLLEKDYSRVIDSVKRPNYFSGEEDITLYYKEKKLGINEEAITFHIDKSQALEMEVVKYLEYVSVKINQDISKQYDEFKHIEGPIVLSERFEECKISYKLKPEKLISQSGWMHYNLWEEDKRITIDYTIEFQDKELNESIDFLITKDSFTKEYKQAYLEENLLFDINVLNENYEGEELELPKDVTFYDKKSKNSIYYLLVLWIAIVISCSMIVYYEIGLRKAEEHIKRKIELTYFINSFTLLYQTGMTIQKSFLTTLNNRLIALSEDDIIHQNFNKIKAAFESDQKFQDILGLFGEYFEIRESRRFNRLLLQTLKQGDDHLIEQLEYMTRLLWDERIRAARKESEKASSKLVFPMLLIFIVILIISIVPTFLEVKSIF